MQKKHSIANRLKIAFLSVSLLVAISGAVGIFVVLLVGHHADVIFEEKYPIAREAYSLATTANAELLALHSHLLEEEGALTLMNEWSAKSEAHLNALKISIIEPADQVALERIHASHKQLDQLASTMATLAESDSGLEQAMIHMEEVEVRIDGMLEEIFQIVDHAEKDMAQSMVRADAAQQNSLLVLMLITLAAFAISFWLGKKISASITLPLNALVDYSTHVASGNLSENISGEEAQDETGTLARAFRTMTDSLRNITDSAEEIAQGNLTVEVVPRSEEDTLGIALQKMILGMRAQLKDVIDGTATIASSVSELSASSAQLASSAAENSTSISETTTTVEEVRQTAELANTKAEQMAEDTQHIRETSQQGRASTEETIESMNKIQSQMTTIAETIISLSEQSQAIGQIIATVDSLSEQSNVLAVNASIEAAKAGEQGKGFSVVAQEVKSLAEQSKQATTQVRSILNEIQKATSTAVMATEQGNKVVEKGTDTAVQAGHAIVNLTQNMEKSSDSAIQIASASQQQRIGMDQITSAMESVREASQQNATSARQLEGAVQTLKDLGEKLNGIVKTYRI